MVCLLWNYGIWLFLFLEMFLVFQIEQGDLLKTLWNIINLKGESMWWKTLMLFPQTSSLRIKKLCCMRLRTTKQWSRWFSRKKSHNETCFQDSQSCSCLVVRSNQPRHQNPNQVHRHQKPTRWHSNQRTFHTWWVESFVVLLQKSHFSSTVCSDTMAKRSQLGSGEERITTKSTPKMNLNARTPSFSSSTSVSPVKKHYGSQDPWKSVAGEDRSGRPDEGTDLCEASDHYFHEQFMERFSSTNYSKLDDDRAWSSQEWKTETTTHERSGRPDKTSWRLVRKVRPDHEEILLDGTSQSVRNGETLLDRSGRLDNLQDAQWGLVM